MDWALDFFSIRSTSGVAFTDSLSWLRPVSSRSDAACEQKKKPSSGSAEADVTMHAECDSFTVDNEFSSDAQGCIQTATEFSSEVQGQLSLTEDQPLFIELCAGSATLSSVVKAKGFDVLPIDHEANRHKTKCKVLQMDLSQQHAIDTLVHITTHYPIFAVHFGLPCGTCSKARGIPMSDGSEGPPPLRSQEFLLGLPDLSDTNLSKVTSANSLYQRAEFLIEHLERLGITWTVENPTNSFLWDLPFLAFTMAHGKLYHCHACAFGGTRKKLTTFLSNNDAFQEMCRFCEDVPPHEHEPWGYDHQLKCFNTSKEAEYPVKMCEQYAAILHELRPNCVQPQSSKRRLPFTQAGGRSNPQVVSEFLTVLADSETSFCASCQRQAATREWSSQCSGGKPSVEN